MEGIDSDLATVVGHTLDMAANENGSGLMIHGGGEEEGFDHLVNVCPERTTESALVALAGAIENVWETRVLGANGRAYAELVECVKVNAFAAGSEILVDVVVSETWNETWSSEYCAHLGSLTAAAESARVNVFEGEEGAMESILSDPELSIEWYQYVLHHHDRPNRYLDHALVCYHQIHHDRGLALSRAPDRIPSHLAHWRVFRPSGLACPSPL